MLVLDYSGSMNDNDKIEQLKNSVALFLDVLDDNSTQDRVGFVRYDTESQLLSDLTYNLDRVNRQIQRNSAEGWTNIGDGMKSGIQELRNNARNNASKLMILMTDTDGMANFPTDRDPKRYVLNQADVANRDNIDVITISFGSDADKTLMAQVAEICGDVHFAVDGSVSECEEELREVFVKIATKWKIKLVQ
jgi:Mg-chelatase subunit ChlD